MKLFKMLTLGLIFALVVSCGNETTDSSSGGSTPKPPTTTGNTFTAVEFQTKIAEKPVGYNSDLTKPVLIVKADGSSFTITTEGVTFFNPPARTTEVVKANEVYTFSKLVSSDDTDITREGGETKSRYAVYQQANASKWIAIDLDDSANTKVAFGTTPELATTALANTAKTLKVATANTFFEKVVNGLPLQNIVKTGTTEANSEITTTFVDGKFTVTGLGAIPLIFGGGADNNPALNTFSTVTTVKTDGVVKVVITLTGAISVDPHLDNNSFNRSIITIPNITVLTTATLSGSGSGSDVNVKFQ